jgi:hypothetical protein
LWLWRASLARGLGEEVCGGMRCGKLVNASSILRAERQIQLRVAGRSCESMPWRYLSWWLEMCGGVISVLAAFSMSWHR